MNIPCGYKIGRLKPIVYLVKNDYYFIEDKYYKLISGEVYRIKCDLATFNETESYSGRFRFTTTVTLTLHRLIDDSFLRSNLYKIMFITEDGVQYIASAEFYPAYTSEVLINDEEITTTITLTTQSNVPALLVGTPITPRDGQELDYPECGYQGFGIQRLWLNNGGAEEEIEFLTCEYNKIFNGNYFDISITFTYPVINDNWYYDLINFPDNNWNARLLTINGDEINESRLFPQYTIQTSEDYSTPNLVTVTLSGRAGSALLGNSSGMDIYRWAQTNEFICDIFDKYVKEVKQYNDGTGWVDVEPKEYRKGLLIEQNSEDCGYYPGAIYRWVTVPIEEAYECVGTNKHYQEKLQMSFNEGKTWEDVGRTQAGQLYQANSKDCGYFLEEWKPVDGEYICEEYEEIVEWVKIDEYYCEPVDI